MLTYRAVPMTAAPAFAYFGPTPAHYIPKGGFCISAFAVWEKEDRVLLVAPNLHERWVSEWVPNWRVYTADQLEVEKRSWRLPSTYIMEGEAPDDALARIMRDQLEVPGWGVLSSKLYNFYGPSRRYPGSMHWDYCFVYRVSSSEPVEPKPWFARVEFVKTRGMSTDAFGSAQGFLLQELGLL
jgi:ADP-ribose pyrophosphatase YjhB (NUDIX family)